MANYQFGNIEGLEEGKTYADRKALSAAGIHLRLMHGIDGNPKVGASSIVLSGGYIDDVDLGDEIIYTGQGGNDLNTGKQIKDQSWDTDGNRALIVSEMHGIPVRVTRGFKHKSKLSPKSGYKYAGLYTVTDHFEEIGKNGFIICRFKLEKITSVRIVQPEIKPILSSGSEESIRTESTILRIVRDTKLSREMKNLYDYSCQICGVEISVRGVKYAEAAHIKPLGKPHGGHDKPDNMVCLCPNHHVMLDKGIFCIESDLTLTGIEGKLNMHNAHPLDKSNIQYHREHIFIND